MDDDLTALDLDVVTITRDGDGMVSIDGGGLSLDSMVCLLRAAEFIALTDHFFPDDEGDSDGD